MQIYYQQAKRGNYREASHGKADIQYLVLHALPSGEDAAAQYANHMAQASMPSSVHYAVDEEQIWQMISDEDIAWHCGTRGVYYHPYCRNENSLGIALCSRLRNGRRNFVEEGIARALALTRALMVRYAIPPERVLRHYDVTHKTCPAPFVERAAAWDVFKARLR